MNRQAVGDECGEAALVRAAQSGDTDAFANLVTRYQDRVYNTCYRLCHDDADAQDLTQSTFLKALQSLRRFESRSSFYTWIFRIAVNLALSHRRTQHRRRVVPLADLAEPDRAWEPTAATEPGDAPPGLEARELRDHVAAALARLEPEFRAAVVLKDIEDLNYATIAEILEVPVGTVKSRISRGRMMLREMLAEERTAVDSRRP